jgi:hypothetical protein
VVEDEDLLGDGVNVAARLKGSMSTRARTQSRHLLQPGKMAFETTLEPEIVGLSLAVGLGRDHVDDLTSARDQIGERPRLRIGYRADFWPDAFSEQCNHFGIEPIGLGEPTYGAGEGTDLARIDDGEP